MPSLFMFLIAAICMRAEGVTLRNGTKLLPEKKYSVQVCHSKIVGTEGFISSPLGSQPSNMTCRWDLDVTKGHVAVLEFEYLRLPDNEEGTCESHVQISYGTREGQIIRTFCSTDQLDTIYTESQMVVVTAVHRGMCQTQCNEEYGFKIHYSGIAIITKSSTLNLILIIIMLTVSVIVSLALCIFCFSCRSKRHHNEISPTLPTRQPLQDVVEFQRHATPKYIQEPRKLSKTPRDTSNLRRWATNSRLQTNNKAPTVQGPARRISIATTPRSSIFPHLRRKWSDSSVQRIQHLKTRLANRFSSSSSHNTSDISVYFSASDPAYSQLRSEEEQHDRENSTHIPSIVIEFVE